VFITQGELARNHQQMCVGSRRLPPPTAWRRPRQSISGELPKLSSIWTKFKKLLPPFQRACKVPRVVGLDNVNDYYDVSLKQARLSELNKLRGFRFVRLDITERDELDKLFAAWKFDVVINLAAQVRSRQPARLHSQQHRRIREHSRDLQAQRSQAPDLCVVQLRLRSGDENAVLGPSERRSSGQYLRREQEGERASGSQLQPSIRAADNGPLTLAPDRSDTVNAKLEL
jgi:hypothetical protein